MIIAWNNRYGNEILERDALGYRVGKECHMQKEQFDITGMTCSACSARVEKSVAKLEGLQEVSVNLLKNSMAVAFDETVLSSEQIRKAVEKAGYGAVLRGQTNKQSTNAGDTAAQELRQMRTRLQLSLAFAIPLFYVSMGHMFGWPLPSFLLGPENTLSFAFTQFLLLLPIIFVNFKYYQVGYKTLFQGAPNMDSLIAIGSSAAAIYGIFTIYKISFALGQGDLTTAHHFAMNLYFESAGMILALITLGKFFEARAKGHTSDAITKLIDLAPKMATVQRGGTEIVIPVEEVLTGDILIVKTGESIPVDGVLTEGSASVDESALTGESIPVEKQTGDQVISATINKAGYFKMQATKVGNNTTLAQIVRLVDEATSSKAPIARLADKISSIFVPVVITIAVLATVVWLLLGYGLEFALSIGISVLVISCPCALGLATPTAIMVGTGKGAGSGILIKSAEALETAHSVHTVILDKTGTITEGKPVVTDMVPAASVDKTQLLTLAASLEKKSEHPLSDAIVLKAEQEQITLKEVTDFQQIPGQGLTGRIDGLLCYAGNRKLIESQGIPLAEFAQTGADFAMTGKTALYFATEKTPLGIIAVADVVKRTSRQAVTELDAMGIEVVMLTGDNAQTAAAIQQQVGIQQVVAEMLPQDKEREIRALQQKGRKVAMIGDGVNDAPALARADIGIAIGAGTDVAIESADIVLMKSDLLDVPAAIQLSRAVMRNIRQNLFWAFFYNSIGIPIAAGCFYLWWGLTLNPMIAAAAMSLSSLCVVSNALRLRMFQPKWSRPQLSEPPTSEKTMVENNTKRGGLIMSKTMTIEGMSCGHCTSAVDKALRQVSGVSDVVMDLAGKTAVVTMAQEVGDDTLTKAVTDAGYEVINIK